MLRKLGVYYKKGDRPLSQEGGMSDGVTREDVGAVERGVSRGDASVQQLAEKFSDKKH